MRSNLKQLLKHREIYHTRQDYERNLKLAQIDSIKEYGASSNEGRLLQIKPKKVEQGLGGWNLVRQILP